MSRITAHVLAGAMTGDGTAPCTWGTAEQRAADALRATLVSRRDLINDFFQVFELATSADLEQMEIDAAFMEQLNRLIRAIDGGLLKQLACEAERKDVTASTTAEQSAISADDDGLRCSLGCSGIELDAQGLVKNHRASYPGGRRKCYGSARPPKGGASQ